MVFIESRISTIAPDEICPILSMQADYENLSVRLREKIEKLSMSELELLERLVKEYAPCSRADKTVMSTLMSVKGALQCRRVLGEKIFINAIEDVKNRFYAFVDEEEKN